MLGVHGGRTVRGALGGRLRAEVPDAVAVFVGGSHLRGDAGPLSDVDFDIVVPDGPRDEWQAAAAISQAARRRGAVLVSRMLRAANTGATNRP